MTTATSWNRKQREKLEAEAEESIRIIRTKLKTRNKLPMVTDTSRAETAAVAGEAATAAAVDINLQDSHETFQHYRLESQTESNSHTVGGFENFHHCKNAPPAKPFDNRLVFDKFSTHKPYDDQHHRWHQKTRFHVALLGLAIAVVNCYAQATFCIAIVEMVLPADYVVKSDKSGQSVFRVVTGDKDGSVAVSLESTSGAIDNSCPIEYQYRDYYDSWRFPAAAASNKSTSALAANQTSNYVIDVSDRFDWDASRQGLLLGAFAIGTAPLQVMGGRLAEIYGAKWVLFMGCIGTALTNLTIPVLARFSFTLLIINRVLMGITQAGMEPGLMCLLAEWLTPTETGFFISMLLFAICIGFFLGSLGSSFLLTLGHGWPITYYVSGGLNLLVALVWMLYASSRPRQSKVISPGELEFIEHEQGAGRKLLNISTPIMSQAAVVDGGKIFDIMQQTTTDRNTSQMKLNNNNNNNLSSCHPKPKPVDTIETKNNHVTDEKKKVEETSQAPWLNILTTRSVWAFIICKISIRWCADVIAIELPTYLANVLHLSIKLNGIINSVSSALFAIFSFLTGYFVNKLLQKQQQQTRSNTDSSMADVVVAVDGSSLDNKPLAGISKTNLRKLMQSFASFGAAISLFLMTRYDCNILFSMSMLLVLSCCIVMGTGGELQIPYDMTSRYPGTLHGMACTLSVSGWLAPPLIGLILGDQPSSRYRWSIVWYMTALINLIGGLVFVLFADASPRDFDQVREKPTTTTTPPDIAGKRRQIFGGRPKRSVASSGSTTGYYNVACKTADNSPPIEARRQLGPTCGRSATRIDDWQQSRGGHAGWSSQFDSNQPIKVRQLEESFIRPYYYSDAIDSVAASVVIFPYRTKNQLDPSSLEAPPLQGGDQEKDLHKLESGEASLWSKNSGLRAPHAGHKEEPASEEAKASSSSFLNLWPRIRRRRRKFCVKAGVGGTKLIGSPEGPKQKPTEPEARAQMASVVGRQPSADVLPHCRKQLKQKTEYPVRDDEPEQKRQEGQRSQLAPPSAAPVSMTTKTITHL